MTLWIAKFLSGRRGKVCVGNESSRSRLLPNGVPQGSPLSPTLFNLFLNDLPVPMDNNDILLSYADDIVVASRDVNVEYAKERLQRILDNLYGWLYENRLHACSEKSAVTLFTKNRKMGTKTIEVTLNGVPIPQKKTQKILGVTFDTFLCFSPHVESIVSTCIKKINFVKAFLWTVEELVRQGIKILTPSITLTKLKQFTLRIHLRKSCNQHRHACLRSAALPHCNSGLNAMPIAALGTLLENDYMRIGTALRLGLTSGNNIVADDNAFLTPFIFRKLDSQIQKRLGLQNRFNRICLLKETLDLRRRRNEAFVELRKSKQENKFSKKRNMNDTPSSNAEEIHSMDGILANLPNCSLDELEQHLETIRLKLSIINPPLDLIMKHNVIPILVRCLTEFQRPNLQFRATWAITNIASSDFEHTKAVVDCQAVPHLINLVRPEYGTIATQAVWALGNITGDCAQFRDLCIHGGYMDALLSLITTDTQIDSLRTYSWALSNLCRYKDPPPMKEVILRVLPYVRGMLCSNDILTIVDGLWALTYASDASEEYIPIIINIPILKNIFCMDLNEFYPPLIRIFGNISSHKDHSYTQAILDNGMLPLLIPLINSPTVNFRKETIWFMSNLAAGTQSQIQSFIDAQILPLIFSRLITDKTVVKTEACWVFRNILSGGTVDHMTYVLKMDDFVPQLCQLLLIGDFALQVDILKCIYAMMCAAHKTGLFEQVAIEVETCDGLTLIEDLQYSDSIRVANFAAAIIKKHFSVNLYYIFLV
ncbi:importin subunit alpha-3-like [Octopus sinensis]|uniref:Importin subunit alpha-3-like n=1 Tax=Octopus sinensis TaxID=2607531 RepID=A0A7E6EME9_9MOLL|nr:importin subunit alpha-3-like [Octopus sinensis]